MFTLAAIQASGFSFGAAWLIVRNVQDLRARVAQKIGHHLTAMLSRASQRNSLVSPPVAIPPAPDPVLSPSGSCLRRAIFYWLIGLLFCLFALFVAILVKQKIRGHRLVLQSHSQPWEKAEVQESLYGDAWYVETDTMYQLFQVSLAILILGHINFFLFPVGPTIFAATVVLGLLYVFGGS